MGPVEEVSAQAMARLPEKKPEPSLQQQALKPGPASDQLHQLHPISETRIPATHLLIAVHAVHR